MSREILPTGKPGANQECSDLMCNRHIDRRPVISFARRKTISIAFAVFYIFFQLGLFSGSSEAHVIGNVPDWNNGSGADFSPQSWPSDGQWIPYTMNGSPIIDPRISDPSNGGTRPQNYVNISSGCNATSDDMVSPSVYFYYANNTLYFRWRVEQIANNYATGPGPGQYSTVNPWWAAQWTVMFDTDGDGFREFAMQLDGSTGMPSQPIDILRVIYSNTLNQNMDSHDRGISEVAHNPTGFVDDGTVSGIVGQMLNFHDTNTPDSVWSNGPAETVWDYGTTRAVKIDHTACGTNAFNEYFLDYQIPLPMVNNGAPQYNCAEPAAFLFATANSLTNPFQKDVVGGNTAYVPTPDQCAAFGDQVIMCGPSGPEIIPQPVVDSVTTDIDTCSVDLTATVRGSMNPGTCTPNVTAVEFYRYLDLNANGQADDGSSWVSIGAATINPSNPGQWTMTWDASGLERGEYLIGVKATNSSGMITWSYLTAAQASPDYANPSTPGVVYGSTLLTDCGGTTTVGKTANKSFLPDTTAPAGQQYDVQFTITVNNATGQDMTVTSVTDFLPQGAGGYNFVYKSTDGGTLVPSGAPALSGTQVTWSSFTSPVITDGSSKTIIFTATAPNDTAAVGSYSNTCSSVVTAWGSAHTINCNYVEVEVGAPDITIAKSANVDTAAEGDTITYTITYSNNSMVGVTNAVITDPLPLGITYVNGSASNGGTYDSGTRTITWNIGAIASQSGPFTVTFQATVDNPYPQAALLKLLNPATICSAETTCKSAAVTVIITGVSRPRLSIEKVGNKLFVDASAAAPANQVAYTIYFENSGNTASTNTTITDIIPRGWTFISADAGTNCSAGTNTAGTVSWTITTAGQTAGTLLAGSSGTCNLVLQAYYQNVNDPYNGDNPSTNTATIQATGVTPISSSFKVGVVAGASCPGVTYYYHRATTDVGYDGSQEIADTIFPTYATSATYGMVAPGNSCDSSTYYPLHAFYEDPEDVNGIPSGTPVTSKVWMQKTSGNPATYRVSLYDYDPATGSKTLIGRTSTGITGSDQSGPRIYIDSITTTGALTAGHRLFVEYDGCSNNNQTLTYTFYYDGTPEPSQFCSQGYNVVMNKIVDKVTALPGDTLNYTITFGNIGSSDTTGSVIVDTLPTGTTFSSATIQTDATGTMTAMTSNCPTPGLNQYCASGQTITFNVHTYNNTTAGVLTTANQGKLVITATVDNPLPSGIYTLVNNDYLDTDQTEPVYGSAITEVPTGVAIIKSEDKTMLYPGDTITYTLKILNSGGSQISVTVTDSLPVETYFSFVSGSETSSNGGTFSWSSPTLTWNGNIPANSAVNLTFQMVVGSAAVVPLGTTYKDNTGIVTYNSQQYSNTVRVAILNQASISLTKAVSPAGPVAPGATVTWSMTVSNVGSQNAYNVQVTDPIPADMTYTLDTLTYSGGAIDNTYFDAPANRVVYNVGTLAPGESRTLSFDVTVNDPMPTGTTTLTNIATATASNADPRQASADIDVSTSVTFTLDKYAPAMVPDPLTTLAADVTDGSVITVADPRFIAVNDVISINGTTRTVTAVSGSSITLDGNVTGVTGANVVPTFLFTFNYENTGGAETTATTVTDTIAAGLDIISYSNVCSHAGQLVTCTLGTLFPGDAGSLWIRVRPTACGTYLNTGSIQSTELPGGQASNQTSTIVCGLIPVKETSTPLVSNTSTGTKAMYTITVTNNASAQATGVEITDNLSSGFSYDSTYTPVITENGATRTSVLDPAIAQHPAWGTWTIDPGGYVTIQFQTDVSGYVPVGTYQNNVACDGTNLACLWFDELRTTLEDVTVEVPIELSVDKTVNIAEPKGTGPGAEFVYTITLTNVGVNHSFKIIVEDLLPAEIAYVSSTPSQGAYNNVTGVWDVGRVDRGASATLTITAYPNDGTAGIEIQNCAYLTSAVPPEPSYAEDDDWQCATIKPTLVTLSAFRGYVEGGKVVVEWETVAELNTVGFYIERYSEGTGRYERINDKLLPGLITSPAGGFYKLIDESAVPSGKHLYRLIEATSMGNLLIYGPFTVDLGGSGSSQIIKQVGSDGTIEITIKGSAATKVRSGAASPDQDFEQMTNAFSRKPREASPETLARFAAARAEQEKTRLQKKDRKGSAVKVTVAENNVYYLDSSDIAAKLNIPSQSVKQLIKNGLLSFSTRDRQVSYMPAKDNSGIFFYGTAEEDVYTRESIYWLKNDKGLRMESVDGGKALLSGTPRDSFTETLQLEQELIDFTTMTTDPNSDYWFWDYAIAGFAPYDYMDFSFKATSVSTSANTAKIKLKLMSIMPERSHALISLNGTRIADVTWTGIAPHTFVVNVDQGLIKEGDNTLTVKALLDRNVPFSYLVIDSFDVEYVRRFEAVDDVLSFRSEGSPTVSVKGFSAPDVTVLDITDKLKPKLVTSTSISGQAGNYTVKFYPAVQNASYIAFASPALKKADAFADLPSDLKRKDNAADYIVITPEELKGGATLLADYRRSKGLSAKVVLLEDIMDEFNFGLNDPNAIKKFLQYAYDNWRRKPAYAVLVGGGTYDYKNSAGYGGNLLPALMVGSPWGLAPSDSILGDFDGDDVPEIVIGRLPALSSAELQIFLNKIMAFEGKTPEGAILLADKPDSGGDFTKDSDDIAQILAGYPLQKIYLTDYKLSKARTALFNSMNQGTKYINYLGHGSIWTFSSGGLLTKNDAAVLKNTAYPVMTALTCSSGLFALPGFDSLMETLMIREGAGIVSSWSPSSWSYNADAKTLGEGFYKAVFHSDVITMGDAVRNSMNAYKNAGRASYELNIFNILGDPALRLK